MRNFIMMALVMVLMTVMVGCKPYNTPKFVEISSSETAFAIPLEGDSMQQDSFASAEYLLEKKVATRRIQIPRRFVKTGRMRWSGEYIDTIRVISVDRSPETRQLVAGQAGAIWVESRDSVGFSVDITIVAEIQENDVPTFLYRYPMNMENDRGSRLDYVIDNEIRSHIQNALAAECAEYNMDILRTMKNEIMESVREQVIPYFAERGVTITNIGMGSGFAYESEEIQRAIDAVVEAQQDKASAVAEQDAQEIRNSTDIARAEAEKSVAQLRADARKYEIDQATAAGRDYIELLNIEVQKEFIEKWDGVRPRVEVNGESDSGLILDVGNIPSE